MSARHATRVLPSLAILAVLCGCTTLPVTDAPASSAKPAAAPVPVAEPVQPVPAPVALPPLPAATPEAAAVATTPEYADLLERMRAGFALGDFEEPRVDRQADWFAGHTGHIERVFTRAGPFLHHIVSQVEARGLPLELALLPVIESAFEPYAYSRARAMGLWQFIPATGTRFGLRQNWWYDGRRDVVASTTAALDYLEFLAGEFGGDWLLAIAAYNCGENAVLRAVAANRKAGRPVDFWHLKLPSETRAYVPKLLAMARIVAAPGEYGLAISGIPDEPFFVAVDTGGQINLEVAAELAGLPIEEIYALNPAWHRWATDPAGPHSLLLPVEAADTFRQNVLELTPDQRMRVERYAVRDGDSVGTVAQRFDTTPQLLRELNGLGNGDGLEPGSELRVPSAVSSLPPRVLQAAALVDGRGAAARRGAGVHVVRRGDTLWNIARRNGTDVRTLARLNGLSTSTKLRPGQKLAVAGRPAAVRSGSGASSRDDGAGPADGRRVTYTVRAGDTLFSIARVLQVTVGALQRWNDLTARSTIRPGQKLVAFVRESRGT